MIPTSTQVSVQSAKAVPGDADAVAVFQTEKSSTFSGDADLLPERERSAVERLIAAGIARGKAKEVASDLIELPNRRRRHVFVAGLGDAQRMTGESLREAAGALAKAVRRSRLKRLAVIPLAGAQVQADAAIEALVSGHLLANFRYEEYKGAASKKRDEEDGPRASALTVLAAGDRVREAQRLIDRAVAIADGQNFARTVASRPGNNINPPSLAKVAQDMAREVGLEYQVLDEKQMRRLGMGGILAVGSGSNLTPPRMIVLEWNGAGGGAQRSAKTRRRSSANPERRTQNPVLVIGKAITFDTGGISIKPAEKMGRMIFDKCGGMAVLGLMYALARLKLPIRVVGILASAENHISETAYRPGDIVRMHNGVTVEVTNTDAEGRLVLGDALAWGIETYKPAAVVNLATLTGGVIVALGKTIAGVISNNDELMAELQRAADKAGERLWRLPLGDEQREQIKSEPADIVNSAGREAQPLQGGAFLSYFVADGMPWAHLDIAGVAETEKELPYYAKGATGWGVRTLVEWVTARC